MVARDLRRAVGDDLIVDPVPREYLVDATEARSDECRGSERDLRQ
jgi:hypothetical protein